MFSLGNQSNTSPFGVPPPLPGAQQGIGGMFGGTATPVSTGLFGGAPSGAPSPFGQSGGFGSGSAFGQQSAAPSPSPFGSGGGGLGFGSQPASTGTSGVKYQTTRDTELNMKLVSVTAMDAYKTKSIEELRWEDYQAGRSTPSSSSGVAPASGGLFGAPAPASGGLFGSTSTQPSPSPFGTAAPTGGMFGGSSSAPSGSMFGGSSSAPTGGMFGGSTTAPSGGGLFGSTTPSTTPFGSTGGMFGSTATPSGGLFGSTTTAAPSGGLFGSSTTPPATGGMFGSTTPSTGMFGASAASAPTGGLFGSSPAANTTPSFGAQPSTGGMFGSSGGLFGSSSNTQQSSGGLFGASQPATGGGLFGGTSSTPAPSGGGLFGGSSTQQQPSSGGLFGSSSTTGGATSGGLFGNTGGGLFGNTTSQQPSTSTGGGLFGGGSTTGGGGLFGSSGTTTTGGGLFGTSSNNTTTPALPSSGGLFGSGSTTTTGGGGLFGNNTSTGTSSLFGNTGGAATGGGATGGGLFGTGSSTGGGLFGSSTPATGGLFGSSPAPTSGGMFGGNTSTMFQQQQTTTTPSTGLGFAQGGLFGTTVAPVAQAGTTLQPLPRPTGLITAKPMDKDSLSAFLWKEKSSTTEPITPLIKKKQPSVSFVPVEETPKPVAPALADDTPPPRLMTPVTPQPSSRLSVIVKPKIIYTTPSKSSEQQHPTSSSLLPPKSVLPKCTDHNIWLKPSIESMGGMTESELSRIDHFQIGCFGIGSVTWPGVTDVRYLVVDENLVVFKKGSVTLFPDESIKPPVGTGLNKTAVIELAVKPKNFDVAKQFEERYIEEMKKMTEKNGAEFLSYDLETWRFRVEHFSTWGIDESDWLRIDSGSAKYSGEVKKTNDLSLFSRLEHELIEQENEDEYMDNQVEIESPVNETSLIGALAVPPLTREELKRLGWDLRICDLFLNQSFRVSVGTTGVFAPEHPVLYDTHRIMKVTSTKGVAVDGIPILRAILTKKSESERTSISESVATLYSLIDSLLSEGDVHTSKFNDWLSQENAKTVQADPELAFSPAALLSTKHCDPTAADVLIADNNPRLALVVQAMADESSREMMRPQLEKVDTDELQEVYDILSGRIGEGSSSDWKAQLALRYWFCDGDMSGFNPPENSLEWKIIKTVILGNSSEIFKLVDDSRSPVMLLAAVEHLRQRKPHLVSDQHYARIVRSVADHLLDNKQWILGVAVLALLEPTPQRDSLLLDLITRFQPSKTDMESLHELGVPKKVLERYIE